MSENDEEWEYSKENIQPLRQGRAISSLRSALDPQCQNILQERRNNFEAELRTYSGDDPLEVWHRYILWLEQHFPSGGQGVNMKELLEKCISTLLKVVKYANDTRFVSIWIRYASIVPQKKEVFERMLELGVGRSCALLFTSWSEYLEAIGDTKCAVEVLQRGLYLKAQPISTLETALSRLQVRVGHQVAQRMRDGDWDEESEPQGAESRRTLGLLHPGGKKGTVGFQRTGAARIVEQQGGVTTGPYLVSANTRRIRVLDQENSRSASKFAELQPQQPVAIASNFVPDAHCSKENSRKPGKWTSARVHQRPQSAASSGRPSFEIPSDEGAGEQASCTPVVVPGASKVLREHHQQHHHWDDWRIPLTKAEAFNPNSRVMYDKHRVYCGTTEFQFEEIRWAKMRASLEKKKQEKRIQFLESQLLEMQKRMDEMQKMLLRNRSSEAEAQVIRRNMNILEQSIMETHQSILEPNVAADFPKSRLGVGAAGEPASSDSCLGVSGVSHQSTPGSSTSTCATADVSRMVRGLWNGTLAHSAIDQEAVTPSTDRILGTEGSNNLVAKAATEPGAQGGIVPFELFRDPTETATGLPHCQMDTAAAASGSLLMQDVEMDENRPPADYHQVAVHPSGAGALHQRVPFAVLEQEKVPEDEEEDQEDVEAAPKDDLHGIQPFLDDDNVTYEPSHSFCKKVTSTPFPRDQSEPPDFTVGGLTEMVHAATLEMKEPQQKHDFNSVARRRASVAAGELSTILECSKEASSKSGSSSSSSSTVGTLSLTGKHQATPGVPSLAAVPEEHSWREPMQQQPAPEAATVLCSLVATERTTTFLRDPFSRECTDSILRSLEVPVCKRKGVSVSECNCPSVRVDNAVSLGNPRREFHIIKLLSTGSYGRVYLAQLSDGEDTFMDTDSSFECPLLKKVALKVVKDPNQWEMYICSELRQRLSDMLPKSTLQFAMDIEMAVYFNNGAILVMPFAEYGTLLDLVSRYKKQAKSMPEPLVLYFTLELLLALHHLQQCHIVHGDFKPDNVVISDFPSNRDFLASLAGGFRCLQLIDFGRGIDMTAFEKGITFTGTVDTEGFQCTEMQDGRPWTYQTDLFGFLGCVHVMLFSEYMETSKRPDGTWGINKKFKRYWQVDLWTSLFNTFLNIPSCEECPDVLPFTTMIEEILSNTSRSQDLLMKALWARDLS